MVSGSLKQRIHDGDALTIPVAPVGAGSAELAAIYGRMDGGAAGCDLAFVDIQHRPYSEAQVVEVCDLTDALGVPALLRIRHTRWAYLAGNYADLGPLGILVPMVETTATVEDAVENFYYPPLGKRSWGPWHAHGYRPGMDREAYAAWWNAHGILALQIETVEGVLNARRLAKPGVDLLLFGGNDLSFSLVANSNAPFDTVQGCVDYVVAQTAGAGVRVAAGFLPYGHFDAVAPEGG